MNSKKSGWRAEWPKKKAAAYKDGKTAGFDLVGKGTEIKCSHKEGTLLQAIFYSGAAAGIRMAKGNPETVKAMKKLSDDFFAAWKKKKGYGEAK